MYDAIYSLAGVIVGGLLTFIITVYANKHSENKEKKKLSKEVLKTTIGHYEDFLERIRRDSYFDEREIETYFLDLHLIKRNSNTVNERVCLNEGIYDKITKIDSRIWNLYNENKLDKAFKELSEIIEDLYNEIKKYD